MLHLIVSSCTLNKAVHTASHSLPIHTSEMCVRLGMMGPSHASSGKAGKYIKHRLLYFMVCPFGYTT